MRMLMLHIVLAENKNPHYHASYVLRIENPKSA